jgi:hypothetical protein
MKALASSLLYHLKQKIWIRHIEVGTTSTCPSKQSEGGLFKKWSIPGMPHLVSLQKK